SAYDKAHTYFQIASTRISVLNYVSPDAEIRETSQRIIIALSEFSIDLFGHNVDLYNALKSYAEHNAKKEQLSTTQWYFIRETLKGFERAGLQLPEEQRNQVKTVKKELSAL